MLFICVKRVSVYVSRHLHLSHRDFLSFVMSGIYVYLRKYRRNYSDIRARIRKDTYIFDVSTEVLPNALRSTTYDE